MATATVSPRRAAPPAVTSACASCDAAIDAARADFDAQGRLVCQACVDAVDLAATEGRAVQAMTGLGLSTLVLAVVSWFANPGFLVTIGTVATGLGVVRAVDGAFYRKHMSARRRAVVRLAAQAGMGLAIVGVCVIVAAIANQR